MPVLRRKHTESFTTIPNAAVNDDRLSLSDRGLLLFMLSKPPEWNFSHKALQAELKLDKKGAIQKSVTNLQKAGYLKIVQGRNNGRMGKAVWYVYDTPYPNIQDTAPHPEIPDSGKPASYKRNNIIKADSGFKAGNQPFDNLYYDEDAGEWRQKK